MKPLKFENESYEVLVQNKVFIKDKANKDYYKLGLESLTNEELSQFNKYNEKISSKLFYSYLIFTTIMIIGNYIYLMKLQKEITPLIYGWEMWLIIGVYFILNIVLHEMGHIFSLKYFGKEFDKFGFKLNFYVFPAFYVQMNETYMLSRNEKIIVHTFGLFVNYLLVNSIEVVNQLTISSESLTKACMFFSATLMWNLIPILNSDGYKILIGFLGLDEYDNIKTNHWLVLTIQTIGVCIALNTVIHWLVYWFFYFTS